MQESALWPWQCNEPPYTARRGVHLDKCLHGQVAHNLTGQLTALLDYLSLGEQISLVETRFASLRQSTMEFWFCFQKHCRTMLLPTWCGNESSNGISCSPPPNSLSGLKSSRSFNHFYCDTFQISSEFSFLLDFRPHILDLQKNL